MINHHKNLHRALLERAPVPELTTVNGVVMSVVFVTAQPAFTGVIGGLSTDYGVLGEPSTTTSASSARRDPFSISSAVQSQQIASSTTGYPQSSALATGPSVAALNPSTLYPSTSASYEPSNTAVYGSSTTDSSTSTSTTGLSTGGKIGLAAGILCGLGVLVAVIVLMFARKKKQMSQESEAETEKNNLTSSPAPHFAKNSTPDAPKLTLRPVSRLVSEFVGSAQQKSRLSQGNMLNTISEANGHRNQNLGPSQGIPLTTRPSTDRPRTGDNPFRDPENPFADPEKAMRKPLPVNSAVVNSMTAPIVAGTAVTTSNTEQPKNQRTSEPNPDSFPLPQSQIHNPAGAQAAQSGVAPTSPANPTPATRYELPGAPAPVVAPGPGPDTPQSNVYRILMDFRPTMEDELELRAGQLVRMLHEYDDGWALCIRLDRSQQGVVPRTCLAAKPSKPRPGPPPSAMGPGQRPMTPQGRPRGSPTPQGPPGPGFSSPRAQAAAPNRAQSPANVSTNTGAFNQPPRPLSPGPRPQPQSQSQKRSMSPGPYGASGPKPMAPEQRRRRSNSAGAANFQNKRNSPVGPSKLGQGSSPTPVDPDSPGLAM